MIEMFLQDVRYGARALRKNPAFTVVAAITLSRALSTELYEVSPIDPLTYGGVALIVTLVAVFACHVPMRRAMRIDPLVALHD